jgi:hypothetical protein
VVAGFEAVGTVVVAMAGVEEEVGEAVIAADEVAVRPPLAVSTVALVSAVGRWVTSVATVPTRRWLAPAVAAVATEQEVGAEEANAEDSISTSTDG